MENIKIIKILRWVGALDGQKLKMLGLVSNFQEMIFRGLETRIQRAIPFHFHSPDRRTPKRTKNVTEFRSCTTQISILIIFTQFLHNFRRFLHNSYTIFTQFFTFCQYFLHSFYIILSTRQVVKFLQVNASSRQLFTSQVVNFLQVSGSIFYKSTRQVVNF